MGGIDIYRQIWVHEVAYSVVTCLLMAGIGVFLVVQFFRSIFREQRISQRIYLFLSLFLAAFIIFYTIDYGIGIGKLLEDMADPQVVTDQGTAGRYHRSFFAYIDIDHDRYIVPGDLDGSLPDEGESCIFVYTYHGRLLVDVRTLDEGE